jgi:hypothetical protein
MNSVLHAPISDVLKKWLSNHVKSYQPRLCCEFERVVSAHLFAFILHEIISWETNYFFLFSTEGSFTIGRITDKSHLRKMLEVNFSTGNTVAIVDPTNGSGCSIDWEGYDGNSEDSEVLVAAWGEHETLANLLVDKMGVGVVFRGN